ncbi:MULTISPECIES: DUF3304 domain-containing protein [unclassified Herbaspirillum]|uniref:DUF3304 domain-containing protein n=1 Tax=unclassified Herbaspirillum TaxID=2624150 RepID=UPI000E2E9775|nr:MULTISPECIES: DUF3304 domain-containing protein [unclassified Herbaspirillum]RFB73237.1 DUF3304 domain-containing protein [Herbaspirillum sp. 3R-3a1]TFI10953.1 DUF3304 domain-containing protein [Herbaspirillum sp. 3R11]TFI30507.1 DUF3304 domain-containing protein [Herbaspirillum sp. 3C11]
MRFYSVSRHVLAGLLGLVLGSCALPRTFTPVQIEGVQHLGPDYNISQFYIDGASGGNVGRGGGGGGGPCCANLPDKWYPGMKSVVRWSVGDWSQENRAEIEKGNYRSVKSGGAFKATVPIEKYDQIGRVYVHFFPGGKVRVVVATAGSTNKDHPIPYGLHDDDTATKGVEVETLFTKEELEERDRQDREYKKKHGDWR